MTTKSYKLNWPLIPKLRVNLPIIAYLQNALWSFVICFKCCCPRKEFSNNAEISQKQKAGYKFGLKSFQSFFATWGWSTRKELTSFIFTSRSNKQIAKVVTCSMKSVSGTINRWKGTDGRVQAQLMTAKAEGPNE